MKKQEKNKEKIPKKVLGDPNVNTKVDATCRVLDTFSEFFQKQKGESL